MVHEGRRVLIDTVSRQILDSVDERLALQRFMSWLYTVKGNHAGVVLISHSTIKLDVPVLLQALTRHKLESKFFDVVSVRIITFVNQRSYNCLCLGYWIWRFIWTFLNGNANSVPCTLPSSSLHCNGRTSNRAARRSKWRRSCLPSSRNCFWIPTDT